MKIYQIDSSARKKGSTSRALAKKLLDKIKKPGDEVIATNDLYGGTYRLFTQVFASFSCRVHAPSISCVGTKVPDSNPDFHYSPLAVHFTILHAVGHTLNDEASKILLL